MFKSISKIEKIIFITVFIIILIGVIISWLETSELLKDFFKVKGHRSFFKGVYVKEDGLVEWLTFLALVFGAFLSFYRIYFLRKSRDMFFLFCTFCLGALFVFGAGEEISWGQRIFEIKSPQFFIENNTQKETNFHNLIISGVRINKLVFGLLTSIIIISYFLIIPILYKKINQFKKIIDYCAIPIPRNFHIYCYILLAVMYFITNSTKKGELLELGGCWIFLMMLYNPFNKKIYLKS